MVDSGKQIEFSDDDELYKRLAPTLCDRNGKATTGVYKLNGKPDPQPSVDLARLTTLADNYTAVPRAYRSTKVILGI